MESDESVTSVPDVGDESVGSSVSERLQDEYENLLKYALVTPAGVFANGESLIPTQTEDQLRLLRTTNPSPLTRPPPPPSLPSASPSVGSEPLDELPVKLITQPQRAPSIATSSKSTSMNTTEGEREREVGVQQRVFGDPPPAAEQSSTYTLDELDATPDDTLPVETTQDQSKDETLAATHDTDIVKLECQLEEWNLSLRQNILAELTQIKMKLLQQQKTRIMDEREKSNERLARLTMQSEELKELVANCERTIAQKDSIIANLTTTLNKQKTKEGLVRSFHAWKLRHCDEKREEFCSRVADDYYYRRLVSKTFRSWQSIRENRWRERVERACQNRAQEVCEQLTRDYEAKVAGLQGQLGAAHAEIASLRSDRAQFEERMKKGFMRGVCALNLEAMSMFKEGEISKENLEPNLVTPLQNVPLDSEHPLPNITTTSHPPPTSRGIPGSKQVLVKLTGAPSSAYAAPPKPRVTPEAVVVERHNGPTHHPPMRPAPRKQRNQLSVKIVE